MCERERELRGVVQVVVYKLHKVGVIRIGKYNSYILT